MKSLAAVALLALASAHCRYDLELLRGRDGGPIDVRVEDTSVDATVTRDVVRPDIPADVRDAGPVDVRPDTTRDVMPSQGSCTSHAFTVISSTTATRFGETLVLAGSTADAGAGTLMPPALTGCTSPSTAAERVYRYVVQTGPRLVATVESHPCQDGFDTYLYALSSCDPGVGRPLGCNDDNGIRCTGPCDAGCPETNSTIELGALNPGDFVYLVVDGYQAQSGAFRLSLAENAAAPAQLPPTGSASTCVCPTGAGVPREVRVAFPMRAPISDEGAPLFDQPGTSFVRGRRPVPLRTLTGVTAQFRLAANNLRATGACMNATALLDLRVQGTVVASFTINLGIVAPSLVTVLHSAFAPITITDQTMVPLEYRLRDITPAGLNCGAVELDWNARENTVTLFGQM